VFKFAIAYLFLFVTDERTRMRKVTNLCVAKHIDISLANA